MPLRGARELRPPLHGRGCAVKTVIEAIAECLPLIAQWIGVLLSQGKDPKAELEAMLATADLAADRAERAKFGP